jgi:hypothetical protein
MARRRPKSSKVVVSRSKVYEDPLHLHKERSTSLVELGKRLKETRLGVGSWWEAQAFSMETYGS